MAGSPLKRTAWVLLLIIQLGFSHILMCWTWYDGGLGLRSSFTLKENIHKRDLVNAIKVVEGVFDDMAMKTPEQIAQPSEGVGRVALLFMLRSQLIHIDVWRAWLMPLLTDAAPRVSVYFHLADGADSNASAVEELLSLPGARRVVPTVPTGWCELVAAEVALLRAALHDDPSATQFMLLPHDSVPLVPLDLTLSTLLSTSGHSAPPTRICPAGVRTIEVPRDCAHAMEPHWARDIRLKHHQWMTFSRAHAEKVTDRRYLRTAVALFEEWMLGAPMCSDEVMPLLAIAIPDDVAAAYEAAPQDSTWSFTARTSLSQLPLYRSALQTLDAYDIELQALGIEPQCLLYAPWPGCDEDHRISKSKRAKSPVQGAGLDNDGSEKLIVDLSSRGVHFGRKLGSGVRDAAGHLALISSAKTLPSPPRRLFPLVSTWAFEVWLVQAWVRWWFQTMQANVPNLWWPPICSMFCIFTDRLLLRIAAIPVSILRRIQALHVAIHLGVFIFSVVAFPEYSVFEPMRKVGLIARPYEL